MSTAKALDTQIISYLRALNINEKKAVLSGVKTFATGSKQPLDFWEELGKEQQLAIEKAVKEADEGKLTSHKEVMKIYENNGGSWPPQNIKKLRY